MTWAAFCDWYFAAHTAAKEQPFRTAERQFRQVCNPELLADVTEDTFTRFVTALACGGMGPDDIRRRVSNLRIGLKWGFNSGLIDPSQFDVDPRGDGRWIWRATRRWRTGDRTGERVA